jgi:glycosyltransferase involved in cell wall biosynthesis
MKIGIDISQLLYPGTGVANYTYNLVKHLLLLDKKNEYRLFFASLRKPKNAIFFDEFKNLDAKTYHFPIPHRLLYFLWTKNHLLPIDLFTGYCDIFFFSDFYRPPTNKKTKGITTVHDLSWKIFPQFHEEKIIEAHQKKLEKTLQYNDTIIVDSKNTKNDLIKYFPNVHQEKIFVIYPGVADYFKPMKDKNKFKEILKKYKTFNFSLLTFNFLLYVGAIEPRKNLDLAIKIFHRLINQNSLSPTTKFFIIGRAGWKNQAIFDLVKRLKLEDKVIFLGYVADEDLPYFYSNALATFYLSQYEGFGLPPVESAKCETPVLLYQNSSLGEIFNEKYPYAKKGEEEKTLIYLLKNKINPKKFLTAEFSWDNAAKKFLAVIENIKKND